MLGLFATLTVILSLIWGVIAAVGLGESCGDNVTLTLLTGCNSNGSFTPVPTTGSVWNSATHHNVKCFVPPNCLVNDTCAVGATGPTCERCIGRNDAATFPKFRKYYYKFGSNCIECPFLPPAPFILIALITFLVGFTNHFGFTVSIYTKIKQLFHYLQLLMLTVSIHVTWPRSVLQFFSIFSFCHLNSRMMILECYVKTAVGKHYGEWISSFIIPTVILLGIYVIEQKRMLSLENMQISRIFHKITSWWKVEAKMRRFAFMVIVLYFSPLIISAIHTFACSGYLTMAKMTLNDSNLDVFLLDQRKDCIDMGYQVLNLIYSFGAFLLLLLPLVLYFTARRHFKWDELDMRIRTYGSLYESYKDYCCHWETSYMLRKMISAFVTELFPIKASIQAGIQFSVTLLYLLFVIYRQPYRRCNWKFLPGFNIHNYFEIISTLALLLVQIAALLLSIDVSIQIMISLLCIMTGMVLTFWLVMMMLLYFEIPMAEDNPYHFTQDDRNRVINWCHDRALRMWRWCQLMRKQNKVDTVTTAKESKDVPKAMSDPKWVEDYIQNFLLESS